jgi:response regulator RpfG family c-di-GMP phosphodiesterase
VDDGQWRQRVSATSPRGRDAAIPNWRWTAWTGSPVEVVIATSGCRENGSDLLAEVHRRWPWMGRIILTGYPGQNVMIRGLEARVDFLLYKPWDDEALRRAVGRLVHEVERIRDRHHPSQESDGEFDVGGEGG